MFGILVFVLCSAGLVYVLVRGRQRTFPWALTAGHWEHPTGHWGHPVGHGPHPGRVWLHRMLAELDTTPAQERAIVDAASAAMDELCGLGAPLKAAHQRVAAAFRNDVLSEQDVSQALDDPEQILGQARAIVARALAKIHGVLDERQRRLFARSLERHHRACV
jgi:uncharacterized membrane protein